MSEPQATPQQATLDQAVVIHDLLNVIEDMRDRAEWQGDPDGKSDPLKEIAAMGDQALVKFGNHIKGL